jgi:hypothetical protein
MEVFPVLQVVFAIDGIVLPCISRSGYRDSIRLPFSADTVVIGTRKMSPCQRNLAIAAVICRMFSSGGTYTSAICHARAYRYALHSVFAVQGLDPGRNPPWFVP